MFLRCKSKDDLLMEYISVGWVLLSLLMWSELWNPQISSEYLCKHPSPNYLYSNKQKMNLNGVWLWNMETLVTCKVSHKKRKKCCKYPLVTTLRCFLSCRIANVLSPFYDASGRRNNVSNLLAINQALDLKRDFTTQVMTRSCVATKVIATVLFCRSCLYDKGYDGGTRR